MMGVLALLRDSHTQNILDIDTQSQTPPKFILKHYLPKQTSRVLMICSVALYSCVKSINDLVRRWMRDRDRVVNKNVFLK